jgi:HprK-related kinase A
LIVAALPADELRRRLKSTGLRVQLGPVVACIRSAFERVETGLRLHYASHRVADDGEFADFHVTVDAAQGIRRYLRPQAIFHFAGRRPFTPLPAAQAYPLLEWGLNWCVSAHCHQYLIIHSAVVERDGRALIMPAPPGSGKSTLCAALVASGWRLFSDELALVELTTGRLIPLPRPISLKNESIPAIARFWPAASIGAVVRDTVKGSVAHASAPRTSVERSSEQASARWVVIPRFCVNATTTLEPLSKAAGFMQLVDNAFNYSVHGRTGFDVVARLIDASDCFRFTYGGNLSEAVRTLDELAVRP